MGISSYSSVCLFFHIQLNIFLPVADNKSERIRKYFSIFSIITSEKCVCPFFDNSLAPKELKKPFFIITFSSFPASLQSPATLPIGTCPGPVCPRFRTPASAFAHQRSSGEPVIRLLLSIFFHFFLFCPPFPFSCWNTRIIFFLDFTRVFGHHCSCQGFSFISSGFFNASVKNCRTHVCSIFFPHRDDYKMKW